jgi:PhnB protein
MASKLSAYISFQDSAREAMQFYQQVFGGELDLRTFGQYGQAGPLENLIMHGQLDTPSGYTLMGADTPPGMEHVPGRTITLILHGDDEPELRRVWDGLSDGGSIQTELEPQMWGDTYGQCTDKFGIVWMFNISP